MEVYCTSKASRRREHARWRVCIDEIKKVSKGLSPNEVYPLNERLWSNFARTGRPGHGWPRYTAERDEHLAIDHPANVGARLDRDTCDFLDALSR
jgi:carboxylesterase type B